MKKKVKIGKIIAIAIPVVLVIAFFGYFSVYNHNADENALTSTDDVKVSVTDEGFFLFDGAGTDDLLIFYPGGKVEGEAYASLMKEIAAKGVDCVLIDMPFNFAMFGITKAQSIINNYGYKNYYIGGHSLGGVAASIFAEDNTAIFDGVVLVAAHSSVDLSQSGLRVISVYGDLDGVMNKEKYQQSKTNLPADFTEVIIKGGNHGNFGTYGNQSGDNASMISEQAQRSQAAEAICDFILPSPVFEEETPIE